MAIDEAASDLFERARSEPATVLARGNALLERLDDADSCAVVYRAMSIAARNAATIAESIEYARMGAEIALDGLVRRECLMTLAGSIAEEGAYPEAIRVLDVASQGAEGPIVGQLAVQRASIVGEAGDFEAAIAGFEGALPGLKSHELVDFIAMSLHNLGYFYTQTGRLREAELALTDAREIEDSLGRHMEVSGTDNNLGVLASYRGDIPEALRRLAMSDETEMRYAGTDIPRHVTRCEVLISAGLYSEALALATRIAWGAQAAGRGEDEATAVLVAGRAALLAGQPDEATALARAASSMFRKQHRAIWADQAELLLIQALYEDSGPSVDLQVRARGVAEGLDEAGLLIAATRAWALAGQISLDLGELKSARADFAGLGEGRSGPVEVRVQRWSAKAALRFAEGNGRGADAAARAGLTLLEDYQAGLGASDLRAGIERQGSKLGEIGLRLAGESGDARRLFGWMERTRARALRYPPVVPDEQDSERALLAELRRVSWELRDPEGQTDRGLLTRHRRLQEQVRASNRSRRSADTKNPQFELPSLIEELNSRSLIELGSVDGRLTAVVIRNRRFYRHEIGDESAVTAAMQRLRFDLRRVARLGREPQTVRDAVRRFDENLFAEIGPIGEDVVLVPSAALLAAPWSVFPSFSGATLTVAPSAEMWWRSRQRPPRGKGVVLAAGPDLDHSSTEVKRIGEVYGKVQVLGAGATGAEVGAALKGAWVAHAACHATFEAENPMFSALRLGDGDFNVYDMERLGQPPDLMVLSACDSGYTDTRAGVELTGLTSALLSMGSGSVVASVGLVPDTEATGLLMEEFHRAIAAGRGPAEALALARSALIDDPAGYVAAASFLCIGGG